MSSKRFKILFIFNKEKFKSYDEILSKSTRFGVKLGQESSKLYKRASECTPYMKDHVKPKVEGVFTTDPNKLNKAKKNGSSHENSSRKT